jgi:hypothetical protein
MDNFNVTGSTKEAEAGVLTMKAFSPKSRDQIEAIPIMEN